MNGQLEAQFPSGMIEIGPIKSSVTNERWILIGCCCLGTSMNLQGSTSLWFRIVLCSWLGT